MQKVNNPSQALAYLVEELTKGKTLANLLLSRTDFKLGRFFVGIPEAVDQSERDFRTSIRGLSGEPKGFARMIQSFISDPACAVLLEDSEPLTSDPLEVEPQIRTRMTKYNREVYWSMSGSDLTQDDILALLYAPVLPYPSSAFFYVAGTSKPKALLKHSDLELVANILVGVAVRAFDTESFLVWWREDLRPFPSE